MGNEADTVRSKGKHVVWPIYFDASASYSEGRRVPKSLAVKAPTTEEIVTAAVSAGFKAELQAGASHPRTPWLRSGNVLIESKEKKEKVIRLIAVKLPRRQ